MAVAALLLVALAAGPLLASGAAAAPAGQRYIVVLKDSVQPGASLLDQAVRDLAAKHGANPGHIYRHAVRGFVATMPESRVAALRQDPRVAIVEPDLTVTTTAEYRSGVDRMDAELHPQYKLNQNVDADIAILDTGVNLSHPDLNVAGGVSYVPGVSSANDDNGHGTHVAGIAAARHNGSGVAGVAPGARVWAVKVLGAGGSGSMSDIIKGVDWVTQRASTIEVVNMSLGAVGRSDALQAAIQKSVAAGVVYVVAAGNSARDVYGPDGTFNTSDDFIPAAYPEVATISALADSDGRAGGSGASTSAGADDTLATFSNYARYVTSDNPVTSPGRAIDMAAPGVGIYSTWMNGGYATASGTSMASPHAAGLFALHMAANGLKPTTAAGVSAVRQQLIDAAQPQSAWRADGNTRDPDGNREPLALAGKLGTGQQPPTQPPAPTEPPPAEPPGSDPAAKVSVSPASQSGQAAPGTSIDYAYTVTNTGTTGTTFTASASGSAWAASASPTTLTLAAGASGTVRVTHSVPANAAAGSSATGQLAIAGGGASAGATFTTTAQSSPSDLVVRTWVVGAPQPGSLVEMRVSVTDPQGRAVPWARVDITMRTSSRIYSGTKYANTSGLVQAWVYSQPSDGLPWTITARASSSGRAGSHSITYPSQ
jgi:subtilisin family serine protease